MDNPALFVRLRAIAHPCRYRILIALTQRELNVKEIEQESGVTQPGLSQHLSVLRRAGLVRTRKHSRMIYYQLQADCFGPLAEAIREIGAPVAAVPHQPTQPARTLPGAATFARLP
jgi:DNA-binding transcriptional ArsR family regulator